MAMLQALLLFCLNLIVKWLQTFILCYLNVVVKNLFCKQFYANIFITVFCVVLIVVSTYRLNHLFVLYFKNLDRKIYMIPKVKDRGIFICKNPLEGFNFFFFAKIQKEKRDLHQKKGKDRLNHGHVRVWEF